MLYDRIKEFGIQFEKIIGIEALLVCALVFIFTLIATRLILPVLRAKKLNQPINMYVKEHASKSGTPTMGGICFIISTLVVMLLWFVGERCGLIGQSGSKDLIPLALTLCLGVGTGLIGFIDDYKKLIKKENEGLNETQKLILQIVIATAYLCMMGMTDNLITSLSVPFTDLSFEFGWFAYPFYLIVIIGFVNSTNITDGLDGLASSIGISVSGGLILLSVFLSSRYVGVASGALLGALLGFLVFNHYPAKVFMGDTGSLFIGGMVMGCALSSEEFLTVIIMSAVFIFEMLSSLWQRLYFKLTHGKRFFKKAPVHHHFQLMNWSEIKIVSVFFIVSVIFCAVGVVGGIL